MEKIFYKVLVLNRGFFIAVNMLIMLSLLLPLTSFANESLEGRVEVTDNLYRVGPGDLLALHVYHQPDFDQEGILVRPDGNASFNGIGEFSVEGKTLEDIRRILETNISSLVVDPQVTLTVKSTRPAIVYLSGAVMHPGMYQMVTDHVNGTIQEGPGISRFDMKLSNILANTGGAQLNADLGRIEIKRGDTGKIEQVNLWKMLKNGDNSEDVWLHSGDSIHIPTISNSSEDYDLLLRSSVGPGSFPIRVIGQVNSPGLYELSGTSSSLNTAIAKAGGYTPGAHKKIAAIRRFSNGNQVSTLYVNPENSDIALYPNDVIYIPEHRTYLAGRFVEQAAKLLSPFTVIGSIGWGLRGFEEF